MPTVKKLLFMPFGSRGDVQPILALSKRLQEAGHTVRVACNADHVSFFRNMGVEAAAVYFNFSDLFEGVPSLKKAMAGGNAKALNEGILQKILDTCEEAFEAVVAVAHDLKPDILLPSSPFTLYTAQVMGQLLHIPVVYCPLSMQAALIPSQMISTDFNEREPFLHYTVALLGLKVLHAMVYSKMSKALHCKVATRLAGVPTFGKSFRAMVDEMLEPSAIVLLQGSEVINSIPVDCPDCYLSRLRVTGHWVVSRGDQLRQTAASDHHWTCGPLEYVSRFIEADSEPPVYIGWGSLLATSAEHMAQLAVGSLRAAGKRGIVLGGYAKLHAGLLIDPDLVAYAQAAVLFVEAVPHEWLLPKCAVTVHHGGMGTTIAGFRAGVPAIVTPMMWDQFNNAKLVKNSGAGLALNSFNSITATTLGRALKLSGQDEVMRSRARELGKLLQAEDGAGNAVQALDTFIHDELDTGKWSTEYGKTLQRRMQQPKFVFAWLWQTCCIRRRSRAEG